MDSQNQQMFWKNQPRVWSITKSTLVKDYKDYYNRNCNKYKRKEKCPTDTLENLSKSIFDAQIEWKKHERKWTK